MTRWLIAIVLVFSVVLVGCTTVETAGEHHRRMMLTSDLNARMMVDDWDYFWLANRPHRLTHWPIRLGY